MKKFFLCLALLSQSLLAITIIGSPDVEINTEGTYLVQIKISSVSELKEEDISITDFKSDNELSDFNFEFRLFENLLNYKRLTLAIPKDYAEDYISFRLNIKKELKKDIFIFLPQNDISPRAKSQVTFKLPAKKIYGEPQRYDIAKILSEELRDEGFEKDDSNSFSLAKPNTDGVDKVEKPKTIPSNQVETIWSVSKSVLQNYDASIYQIMWAFYLENPNAFIDEDINRVRGDIDLLLPSQELVTSTSAIAAKESIAFMDTRRKRTQEISIKPILKLTAPEVLYSDSESIKDSVNSSAPQSTPTSIIQIDNSDLNASEIVSKNTSIIELNSEANFSKNTNNLSDSKGFDLRDLFWVALLSLVLGFSIAYMLIRSSKKPAFTRSAVEEDLQDENNTFQTNLSISNDIETQELDLVRTYIAMDDWDSAIIILDKLVATSTNNSIISEAQSLLKEKK